MSSSLKKEQVIFKEPTVHRDESNIPLALISWLYVGN